MNGESLSANLAAIHLRSRKPMIVQVGKYYPPFSGGIENNTRQVAQALKPEFRSVVVCMQHASNSSTVERISGVPVLRVGRWGTLSRQALVPPVGGILDKLQPDCIYFHAPNPLFAVYVAAYLWRRPNVRLVISHHSDLERPKPVRWAANVGYRMLLRRADKIVAYSEHNFRSSAEIAGYWDKRVIIPHGTEMPPESVARSWKDGRDRPLEVGFLGRLEKWKGVHVLAETVATMQGVNLSIAGDGAAKKTLETLLRDLGLGERARMVGVVTGSSKWEFLRGLDVLVVPSLGAGETFGQVLVEAQLAFVPVVASDLPTGIQDVVEDGRSGLLVAPGDKTELAAALDRLRCAATRHALAIYAGERARELFTAPRAMDDLQKLTAQVLGQPAYDRSL